MRRTALDSPWVTAAFGLVVALLTWDYVQITPATGLDASWILGLNLAASQGLDHGTEIIFTYGPLGFLEQPMVVDGLLATLGGIYLLAVRAMFAAALLWAARRSFSWPIAAAMAVVVAAVAPSAIVPQALVAIVCLVALADDAPPGTRALVIGAGPVIAALELLVKINVGITVAIVVAITILALPGPRLRHVLTAAAIFAATTLVLWLLSGQGLSNLDDYIGNSWQVISGYSENSQVTVAQVAWDWLAALLVGIATIGAAVLCGARLRTVQRIAMLAIVAALVLALEKYSFVRHDTGHVGAFFGCLAAVWVALPYELGRRPVRWIAPAAVVVLAALHFVTAGQRVADSFDPDRGVDQLRTLWVPGERSEAADQAMESMQAAYAVDPSILDRIGDSTVDARPWEIGLIWANELVWKPLPVIQDYAAYTPELDRINAEALAAPDGPRFILRHYGFGSPSVGAEGRYINYDVPLEARVMFCDFEPAITADEYQLLERAGGSRCGPERPLGTVEAAYGEPVEVPDAAPGEAVFVRINGVDPEGIERLRTLLYRSAIRRIGLGTAQARFAASNASDGLLIRVSPRLDLPRPFNLAPGVDSISIDSEGGFATSEPVLRYEFFVIPVSESFDQPTTR